MTSILTSLEKSTNYWHTVEVRSLYTIETMIWIVSYNFMDAITSLTYHTSNKLTSAFPFTYQFWSLSTWFIILANVNRTTESFWTISFKKDKRSPVSSSSHSQKSTRSNVDAPSASSNTDVNGFKLRNCAYMNCITKFFKQQFQEHAIGVQASMFCCDHGQRIHLLKIPTSPPWIRMSGIHLLRRNVSTMKQGGFASKALDTSQEWDIHFGT